MAKVKVPRGKYIGRRINPRTPKSIEVQESDKPAAAPQER
jgi:hypothetical protein